MKKISNIIDERIWESLHQMTDDHIFEMATLSRPSDNLPKSTKICVYGEKDEQGTKTPHFHVKIDNGDIELEVKIKNIKDLEIWRTKKNYPKSWHGLRQIKDSVFDWLYRTDKVTGMTGVQRIVDAWNLENPNNEIDDDYYKD